MDKTNINLVDSVKRMKIFLSPGSAGVVRDFRSNPGSPLSESDTFSSQIDVALFIFFNAVGPENNKLNINKINDAKRTEIAKKELELPVVSSKINNVGEIILSTYLALNPREDLVKVMNQDDPQKQKKEIEDFLYKVRTFIENTIEIYADDVLKMIYDKDSKDSIRTPKYLVNKLQKASK